MNKEVISTTNAPAAVGPYSQAIKVGDTLYTSGQIALDPATGAMAANDIAMYNNYTAMFNGMYLDWQKKYRREHIPTKNTKTGVSL